MLRTFVKISAVTNLSDARYCAAMGVDMLGFGIDPALPGYVEPDRFRAITEWVAGVALAGETASLTENPPPGKMEYAVAWLQASHADWPALRKLGWSLICQVDWTENDTFRGFQARYAGVAPHVDYFLLESEMPQLTDETSHYLKQVAEQYPVLLGFGISKDTILAVLSAMPLAGIALQGGHETRPGQRDFDSLAEILELLETDE